MLSYDQPIDHGGLAFRVRTEHLVAAGGERIIASVLYRGRLVSSRSYAYNSDSGRMPGLKVCGLMGRYHRQILLELARGQLDDKIRLTPGTGEFRVVKSSECRNGRCRVVTTDTEHIREENDGSKEFARAPTTAVSMVGGEILGCPSVGPDAVLTGDLMLLHPRDLIEFLAANGRSGTLMIMGQPGIAEVYLRDGALIGAVSPACPTIGPVLDAQGIISEYQLNALTRGQRIAPKLLVAKLLHERLADTVQIRHALIKQIHFVLIDLLGWRTGYFSFDPQATLPRLVDTGVQLTLDTRAMLLDAVSELEQKTLL